MANLLIVHDALDDDFTTAYSYPDEMEPERAAEIADAAIRAVKEHKPENYHYNDLAFSLADWGIVPIHTIVHASERF